VGSTRGFSTIDPERQGILATRAAPRPLAVSDRGTSSRSGTLHLPQRSARSAASHRP
jgi:hypothetical protein